MSLLIFCGLSSFEDEDLNHATSPQLTISEQLEKHSLNGKVFSWHICSHPSTAVCMHSMQCQVNTNCTF